MPIADNYTRKSVVLFKIKYELLRIAIPSYIGDGHVILSVMINMSVFILDVIFACFFLLYILGLSIQ